MSDKLEDIKVCILRIEGTNNEHEVYNSFKRLGATPELVHLKQLIGHPPKQELRRELFDYRILMIPGGFSTGDYVRAGAIFAALIKSKLMRELREYIKNGYAVGGICNGFQVLVELGLLPGDYREIQSSVPMSAALTINDSNRFECRPTLVKHENDGKCAFTHKIPNDKILLLPSAHAEGKFLLPNGKEKAYLKHLIDNDQIVFRYVDAEGEYAGYPFNPNGSLYNIAGICNAKGNVFGLMPHPERAFYRYLHPDWTKNGLSDTDGDGKAVFESVLEYVRNI